MEVKRTFWVVFIILILCSIGLTFLGQEQSRLLIRLIYLCIFLIIGCFLWAWASIRLYSVRRFARGIRQQLGQVFEERFEIINKSRFQRPWLTIHDESPLPGSGGSRVLSRIGPHELRNYSAYTLLTERGHYPLGPTLLVSGDPFGLFTFKKEINGDRSVLVLPYMVDLRSFPFLPGLLPGGKAKRLRTPEVTPHAASIREYAPGDSLNRIHWPTTIRRDHLMVKEFEQDPQADVWVLVDAEKKIRVSKTKENKAAKVDQFWLWRHSAEIGLPEDSFEYAVSIAASVSKYFIQKGQSVGFGGSSQPLALVTPERGERQLGKILETLALLHPNGQLPLLGLLESQFAHMLRGTTVVIITSSANTETALAIDALLYRGMHPAMVLLDPGSFGAGFTNAELATSVRRRGVPVAIVKNGADLSVVLEQGFSSY
jgi:uncharacterized protein (DUF58 family)